MEMCDLVLVVFEDVGRNFVSIKPFVGISHDLVLFEIRAFNLHEVSKELNDTFLV